MYIEITGYLLQAYTWQFDCSKCLNSQLFAILVSYNIVVSAVIFLAQIMALVQAFIQGLGGNLSKVICVSSFFLCTFVIIALTFFMFILWWKFSLVHEINK